MAARWSQVAVIVGVSLASPAARADQQVQLEAVAMEITIPDGWLHESQGDLDVFTLAEDGGYIGSFLIMPRACAEVISNLKQQSASQIVEETVTPLPGWSGFDYADGDQTIGTYCRDAVVGARYAAIVSGNAANVGPLVRAVSAGIDAHEGVWAKFTPEARPDVVAVPPAPPRAPPTLLERFGPTLYELALVMPSPDGTDTTRSPAADLGVSLAASRTPWHSTPLTWSYRTRVAATGAGTLGMAEAGVGLASSRESWGIALQAIAGVANGVHDIPFGGHVGGQIDLQYHVRAGGDGVGAGFELAYSLVRRDGGTAARFQGGFIGSGVRRGLTVAFGWERTVDAEVFTITFGLMLLPRL